MTRYKIPCPDLPKGERCPLCGYAWVCMQPERKQIKPKVPSKGANHG